jgi:hypothetical protein
MGVKPEATHEYGTYSLLIGTVYNRVFESPLIGV